MANTLYDVIKGRIIGNPDYEWLPSRHNFYTTRKHATFQEGEVFSTSEPKGPNCPNQIFHFDWSDDSQWASLRPVQAEVADAGTWDLDTHDCRGLRTHVPNATTSDIQTKINESDGANLSMPMENSTKRTYIVKTLSSRSNIVEIWLTRRSSS